MSKWKVQQLFSNSYTKQFKTPFCARLLPLTRHYHQCAVTFWMGKDTGEVEKMKQCQKQTIHTWRISQLHKQRDIIRRTCKDANIHDRIIWNLCTITANKVILRNDFLPKNLNNFKYDLIVSKLSKVRSE